MLVGILHATPASAHSSYAVKVKTLEDPNGSSLILEKLYGDGIFFADPVKVQIRNKNGVVIAQSKTATHIGIFCPYIQFCWAFPYETLFVNPIYLDFQKLNYKASLKPKLPSALIHYLNGSTGKLPSSAFNAPVY
jgi:hypothetical protein